MAGRLRILVSGVDFGWGSAGKLSSILESLCARTAATVIGLGTVLGRPVLGDRSVTEWRHADPTDRAAMRALVEETNPDLALVVLDPALATALQEADCPVVYVDSLPFLWTEHDPMPTEVALYCAQSTLPLPPTAAGVLGGVRHLSWVPPIVPGAVREARESARPTATGAARRTTRDDGLAVVNVGGLHSPFTGTDDPSYLHLALPPALDALAARGVRRTVVTGNVGPDALPAAPPNMTVEARSLSHGDFIELIASAGHVVSSPGLTSILELAAMGRGALLLPPQNLSQVLNGDLVAERCQDALRVPWPTHVMSRAEITAWHREGEDHAVTRIRTRIAAAASTAAGRARVAASLAEPLAKGLACTADGASSFSPVAASYDGADRVAEAVIALASQRAAGTSR
ncbi:hydroxymethylcytosylglucuronate/cytosylglucuronate synthase [Streptomyces sp. NBC_01433]|uniref:hydroxymethylcytosylglucuronate/cytosylglucurona te synthase n=1 Tax=Streptomyces sp. NBC_01433 TaxID=2903864 RepID=UPI002252CA6C|nr:hydroxymethylcytosylglucuronate/cytosylglucuronate synthase [Streptomyces sp. NBC_01433]MCX4680630.1 hydroxymethylcytosylglucuronate/cytosylglucuronate synthase [Streptomyces sp. NBC_01433]